ncbi:hypothetical protein BpHYR1_020082 [Brachionus plicatilis]|uniref:Uncharacterized protein n=1 Tax=Brachionus plicatilis TaxID=10195 RepID=A0A3M7REW8_BRAPC|nr:hypothetical protein BpHYR1_020082 [Brachionus plicatilis]
MSGLIMGVSSMFGNRSMETLHLVWHWPCGTAMSLIDLINLVLKIQKIYYLINSMYCLSPASRHQSIQFIGYQVRVQ